MARKLKIGNALLAEHIVQSSDGKHTIVNAYSGDITIWGALPAGLLLALYVEFIDPVETIEVELRMDGEGFAKFSASFHGSPDATPYVLALPLFQLGVDRDLVFDVIASAEGFAPTTVLKRRISQGAGARPNSPTASPPPSSQSPPDAPAS